MNFQLYSVDLGPRPQELAQTFFPWYPQPTLNRPNRFRTLRFIHRLAQILTGSFQQQDGLCSRPRMTP
ncbi:hypothetical protein K438DRAFT_1858555 [Mycena galopus ATCC 62051]|nr:hypothetical protein K438DRAFT_1858555 [Mycena galopus ATCC 62051]